MKEVLVAELMYESGEMPPFYDYEIDPFVVQVRASLEDVELLALAYLRDNKYFDVSEIEFGTLEPRIVPSQHQEALSMTHSSPKTWIELAHVHVSGAVAPDLSYTGTDKKRLRQEGEKARKREKSQFKQYYTTLEKAGQLALLHLESAAIIEFDGKISKPDEWKVAIELEDKAEEV